MDFGICRYKNMGMSYLFYKFDFPLLLQYNGEIDAWMEPSNFPEPDHQPTF